MINILGVNTLRSDVECDFKVLYKHYHLEIVCNNKQERELKNELYTRGLAIDFRPFVMKTQKNTASGTEHQQNQSQEKGIAITYCNSII